jgi:flagellar biosynthesis protein FlhG
VSNICSIGGGKGGTGKSFVTGSLGLLLAKHGYKTLLIDIDFGAANLHTIIGISHPERSISDFINLAHEPKMKLLRSIAKLPYEYILLDLGAGTSFNTIDFFMISNSGILVTTPEPTSIENIYRLIRSVYFRKIRQVLKVNNFRTLAEEAERRDSRANVSNPDILLYVMKELDPEKGEVLERSLRDFNFRLILNQLRKQDNPNIGALVCKVIERHLSLKMHFIGNIGFDDQVHSSVCKKIPFIDLYPYTQTASDIRGCCKKILEETPSLFQSIVD